MKKYFFLICLIFHFHFLAAQDGQGSAFLDREAQFTPEQFTPEVLNKKDFLDYYVNFTSIEVFFQSGNSITAGLDYVTPSFILSPYVTTGIGFNPFTFYYGAGLNLRFSGLLLELGYLGAPVLSFILNETSLLIRNERKFVNLGYFEVGFNFSIIEFKNRFSYGEYAIANFLDSRTNKFVSVVVEQFSNETDLNFLLFSDFSKTITLKNSFIFRYLVEESIYATDYVFSLENIFKFNNFMEVAIVPKVLLANSSDPGRLLNESSFFKISPLPGKFLGGGRLVSIFQSSSYLEVSLQGLLAAGLDLGYRIFPFSYIKKKNPFKGIYLQPTAYFGWVIKEDVNLSKSETTVSLVLNAGYLFAYSSAKITLGVGWNDRENLVVNFGSSFYY